jgi:hypothetical protein
MSIDYSIGEAVARLDEGDDGFVSYVRTEETRHPNDPMFPNSRTWNNHNNHSNIGGSDWIELDQSLSDKHLGDDLLNGNEDAVKLTPELIQRLSNARFERQLTSNLSPGYSRQEYSAPLPDEAQYDWIQARLLWIEGWMNWANRNCENPCIVNF